MNESDTDIQMFAQWIAHAAGFAASLAESQEHAHHPEAWRSELDGLIVLGRMVMLDSPMSAVEPAVRLALQEALVDGEAQLHYLTFSYLPARNHHADADSSPEVM